MTEQQQQPIRFSRMLLALGGVLALVFAWDLAARGLHRIPAPPVWEVHGGDAHRGRQAVAHYGCGSCHIIPGVRFATGRVGPQLRDFRNQIYVAGVLPNSPTNLVNWIQHPQQINPQTAMPDLGVTEQDARDIAAFLYTVP